MENEPLQPVPQLDSPQLQENTSLQAQIDSLQHLVITMLVLLNLVAGTLLIFLMRQLRNTKADLQATRPGWTNVMVQYQHNGPIMEDTAKKFQEFGKSNPDFSPILLKYGLKAVPTNATIAPSGKK